MFKFDPVIWRNAAAGDADPSRCTSVLPLALVQIFEHALDVAIGSRERREYVGYGGILGQSRGGHGRPIPAQRRPASSSAGPHAALMEYLQRTPFSQGGLDRL